MVSASIVESTSNTSDRRVTMLSHQSSPRLKIYNFMLTGKAENADPTQKTVGIPVRFWMASKQRRLMHVTSSH